MDEPDLICFGQGLSIDLPLSTIFGQEPVCACAKQTKLFVFENLPFECRYEATSQNNQLCALKTY
jgi:hypothetical protein